MGLTVALVADDLTGALDAAAPFAGCGLRVQVHRSAESLPAPDDATIAPGLPVGPKPDPAGSSAPGTVLSVSTSSRHVAPSAARAAVTAAGCRLRAWSPRLVFKKVDSTLRGSVPDEVAAAMEVFGRGTALVCPAFPDAGRIVRDGEVFVHGEPLRETEYTRDLRTPSPAESLAVLLGRIGTVRGLRPDDAHPEGPLPDIVVADAQTASHLARLAGFVAKRREEILAVGSDGLASGLARVLGTPGPPVRPAGGGGRTILFALGSRTRTTANQTERLRRASPRTRVVDAPAGVLDAGAVIRAAGSARAVVARVPPRPRGEPGAVARAFGAGVRSAVEGLGGPGRLAALVVTGGDTVEAIMDAFDIAAFDVRGEFRPGVPVSRAAAGDAELTLVSKAGGFGAPELFAELAAETAAS